jgi:SAM-dependent methyltransferase
MATNETERQRWNAESQATTWPRRERITREVTPILIGELALKPGERVLDVGCGGGVSSIEAARAVGPSGAVTGFDLSVPLVELAKQRAADAGVTNLTYVAGDAQTDAIPGAPFDVAMSQFGVMFFGDPVAAFTNIRRHLKDGARMVFACWQPPAKNTWFPGPVLAKYAPPPPQPEHGGPPSGPFAFADPAYVERILTAAGFRDVTCRQFSLETAIEEDSIIDRETIAALRVDDALKEEAWTDLQGLKAKFLGDDGLLHITVSPQFVRAIASS